MKIRFQIIILLTVVSYEASGQVTDSVKVKKWTERREKARRQRDSLETIFNSVPQFFKISLELNHEKADLPDNSKFYAIGANKVYESKKSDNQTFQFDDLPDSVQFVLQLDTVKIKSGVIKKRKYEHGGYLTFGYYDNVLEIRKKWKEQKDDWDYEEWRNTASPYLIAIKNKKVIRTARRGKLGPIEFVTYIPRVYGDPTVTTTQRLRPK